MRKTSLLRKINLFVLAYLGYDIYFPSYTKYIAVGSYAPVGFFVGYADKPAVADEIYPPDVT